MNRSLYRKAVQQLVQLPVMMAALVFLPAWTFDYWQGWVFLAVFFVCTLATTLYLAIRDPDLLARRMSAGPTAEKEKAQKIIITFTLISFVGSVVLPAIDHRLGWSHVPASIVILGNALVALGFLMCLLVLRENTFSASTIQVVEGQRVISTGPYAILRHPMYSGALILMLGIPLALGSWWGLLMMAPATVSVIARLLDEEKFLSNHLAGYSAYKCTVPYRLIPFVW